MLTLEARPDLRVVLAYVAHGLRDTSTDAAEAARVAALAEQLEVEHVVLPVTVVTSGSGIESDARDVRHAALEAEAQRRGAAAVVLGHHADDQAETLLLRIARGTGVDGLAGMAAVAGLRLRPLLDVRRSDVHRAALALRPGVLDGAAHDPMNDDGAIARVRVRTDVLPALERVGPDVVGALTRLAALARDESAVLDAAVAELVTTLPVVRIGAAIAVPSAGLRALPDGLARRVLRAALAARDGGRDAAPDIAPDAAASSGEHRSPDATTVERLLRAPDGWRATLPGPLDAEVGRGWHVVAPVPVAAPARVEPVVVVLDAGVDVATVEHVPSGIHLTLTRAASAGTPGPTPGPTPGATSGIVTLIARPSGGLPPGLVADRLTVTLHDTAALHVRTRRDGDRVRTPGGTRSLSDVMAEAGVPRALRDLLPVVVGEQGEQGDDAEHGEDVGVRWVPGLVVDERVHARTTGHGPRPAAGPT